MFYKRHGKRALDLLLVLFSLIVLAPIMLMIVVLLCLCQGRPVLFTQSRIGENFLPFRIYKFRTMHMATAGQQEQFSLGLPDRRTPVGRVLRKFKLDELPQLVNVLVGQMSLVGPRPEVPGWVDSEDGRWRVALSVKPGLTDYASLTFFDEETQLQLSDDAEATYRNRILPRKLSMAESYVNDMSFSTDLRIMMLTALRLIRR